MKARGKRAARRPWLATPKERQGLKGRNSIPPFSGLGAKFLFRYQGRRAARLPLAFHIPRLWRCHSYACDFLCKADRHRHSNCSSATRKPGPRSRPRRNLGRGETARRAERNKGAYYDALTVVRTSNDIEHSLKFFLVGVAETAANGKLTL